MRHVVRDANGRSWEAMAEFIRALPRTELRIDSITIRRKEIVVEIHGEVDQQLAAKSLDGLWRDFAKGK